MGEAYIVRRGGSGTGENESGRKYLYRDGDGLDSLTGGWAETSDGTGSCILEADGILLKTSSSQSRKGVVTGGTVDLTDSSKLCMEVDVSEYVAGSTQLRVGIHTTGSPVTGTGSVTSTCKLALPYSEGRMQVKYDVSSRTDAYYIWASLANATKATVKILRIWLE